MTRGMSFEPTRQEREAMQRREHVKSTAITLLARYHSVTADTVFKKLDHKRPPPISPANSGNILAMLAREGVLMVTIMRSASGGEHERVYSLPPRRFATLPVKTFVDGDVVSPVTREMLMAGKARPRRPAYISQMPEKCVGSVHEETPATTQAKENGAPLTLSEVTQDTLNKIVCDTPRRHEALSQPDDAITLKDTTT